MFFLIAFSDCTYRLHFLTVLTNCCYSIQLLAVLAHCTHQQYLLIVLTIFPYCHYSLYSLISLINFTYYLLLLLYLSIKFNNCTNLLYIPNVCTDCMCGLYILTYLLTVLNDCNQTILDDCTYSLHKLAGIVLFSQNNLKIYMFVLCTVRAKT